MSREKYTLFADALRELIDLNRWSQERLAKNLKMSPRAVAYWFAGERQPNASTMLQLAGMCDGELSEYFALRGGVAESEALYYSRSATRGLEALKQVAPTNLTIRARNNIVTGADILVDCADRGSEYAKDQLKHFSDQINVASNRAVRLLGAGSLEEKIVKRRGVR